MSASRSSSAIDDSSPAPAINVTPTDQTLIQGTSYDRSDIVWDEQTYYRVEKIVNRRIKDGILEYEIKWLGYDSSENTWEQEQNVECEYEIEEFLAEQAKGKLNNHSKNGSETVDDQVNDSENGTDNENMDVDFDSDSDSDSDLEEISEEELKRQCISLFYQKSYDEEPKIILNATFICGDLMFLIEWENTDTADIVPASIANVKWPELVIKFYQERINFIKPPM